MSDNLTFQPHLAEFVFEHKLTNIVETGLGVSTKYLLSALDRIGEGHLTSIDPAPWYKGIIQHPRLTWMQMRSREALELIATSNIKTAIDLFLHDGSHNIYSQTLEYWFGWICLREGGWMASDDYTWGQHGAWQKFLDRHELKATKLNSLEMVQKTTPYVAADVEFMFKTCEWFARQEERDWLASGGVNSDIFKDY